MKRDAFRSRVLGRAFQGIFMSRKAVLLALALGGCLQFSMYAQDTGEPPPPTEEPKPTEPVDLTPFEPDGSKDTAPIKVDPATGMATITGAGGPTKSNPAASHASANAGFSDRKP